MIFNTNGIQQAEATHRRVYGSDHAERVTDQLIEEMAELTQALLKRRRWVQDPNDRTEGTRSRVVTEMTDVLLCLEFLGDWLGIEPDEMAREVTTLAGRLDTKLSIAERRGR